MAAWAVSFPPLSFPIVLTFGECLSASRGGKDRPSPGFPSLSGTSKKLLELGSITAPSLGPLGCCGEGPGTSLLPQREFSILGGGEDTLQGHVNHQMYRHKRSQEQGRLAQPVQTEGRGSLLNSSGGNIQNVPPFLVSSNASQLSSSHSLALMGLGFGAGKGKPGDEPLRAGMELPSELSLQRDKEMGLLSTDSHHLRLRTASGHGNSLTLLIGRKVSVFTTGVCWDILKQGLGGRAGGRDTGGHSSMSPTGPQGSSGTA